MAALDLFCVQGTDFQTTLDIVNDDGTGINVAGYIFTGQLRNNEYSVNAAANLTITAFDVANGNTLVTLNAQTSSQLVSGSYLYAINMYDTSNVTTQLLHGLFVITPSALQSEPVPT